MVQEETYTKKDLICLIQVKPQNLDYLLSKPVKEGNLDLKSIEGSQDLKNGIDGRIIAFIIGSEVQDPIQSAQRLHAYNEEATIIILGKSGDIESLQKAINFSPFIGVDVYCLDETNKPQLKEELNKILINSRQAAKYRDIVTESNPKISFNLSSTKSALSQRFINKLMDIAPIGIAIVGTDGKLLGWNKEAASIFRKSEAQVLGMPLTQLFSGKEAIKLEGLLEESLPKRKTDPDEFLELERERDSTKQYLSLTAAPFTFSEGSEKAFILAIKDVTERRQAQLNLQEINKTLEERVEERTRSLLSYQEQLRSLASQLSKAEEKVRHKLAAEIHDNLGQMLAVNKMKVESLQQRNLPQSLSEEVTEIEQGINDALSYARDLMTDLKPPPSLDKEDVTATIEWVAKKMKKHDLKVVIEDDSKPKRASEEVRITLLQCVREVLFNIIRHARVGKAWLDMSRTDHQIKIVIEDKGKGFNPEQNLYDPNESSGFGLFNIRERLDLLGGTIEIKSEPNRGTRVELIAPLKDDEKEDTTKTATPSEDTTEEVSNKRINVMLVDDHKMVLRGLKKILDEERDLKVVAEAGDGREAIELAKQTSPDIIVMDINLPGIDGIEATREILSFMSDVRIIGLSLHDQQEVIDSIRDAGATAYLSKNEAFKTLAATIRSEAKAMDDE